jgi:hypothetical protein
MVPHSILTEVCLNNIIATTTISSSSNNNNNNNSSISSSHSGVEGVEDGAEGLSRERELIYTFIFPHSSKMLKEAVGLLHSENPFIFHSLEKENILCYPLYINFP